MPNFPHTQKIARLLLSILFVLGVASQAVGIRHALTLNSHDLQWQGAWLVRHHIDPYAESLAHHSHLYPHFSPPNYLYHLYILLLPLSLLSFWWAEIVWCAISILCSVLSVLLLRRLYRLTAAEAVLAFSLLWIGSPARVALEVGQFSFVVLFFFCLAYFAIGSPGGGLAFGVTLAKYSFSPPAVLLSLLRLRVRFLLFAAALPAAGLLLMAPLLRRSVFLLASEPFQVSRISVSPGLADVMTLTEHTSAHVLSANDAQRLSYALALGGSILYVFLLRRFRLTPQQELPLVTLAALFLFKHLSYDFVFLVIPLCFALSLRNKTTRNLIVAGIVPFWFLGHILDRSGPSGSEVSMTRLAVNVVLLAILFAGLTAVILRSASVDRSRALQQPDLHSS